MSNEETYTITELAREFDITPRAIRFYEDQGLITADRTATAATVHVIGSTLSVVPGWTPTITQSASMPVERLTG